MVVGDKRKYLTCLVTLKVHALLLLMMMLMMMLMMAMTMMYLMTMEDERKYITLKVPLLPLNVTIDMGNILIHSY